MNPVRFYILLIFILIPYLFFAQRNPQPYFRNYSTEDGLPSPEVYCAFEDSRGYMWFGTDNGAARFDGYEFKTYGPEEGLMSNVVLDVYEDGRGRIWFATMTGDAFILGQDTIAPYQYNHLVHQFDDRYEDGRLAHVYEDGKTLFSLKGFGFLTIDTLGNIDTLTGNLISSNLVLHDDRFAQTEWVSNSKAHHRLYDSLYVANVITQSVYFEIYTDNGIIQKKLSNQSGEGNSAEVARLKDGKYLIYAHGNLHCLLDTNLLWTIENHPGTNEITHEKDGGIWFCQRHFEGLRRYDGLKELQELKYQEYLVSHTINQILIDSKNNLWATTLENGIFRCSNLDLITYNKDAGLEDEYIVTASIQNDSIVHIGTYEGFLYTINTSTNEIINRLKGLNPYDYYSIFYDDDTGGLYHGFSKLIEDEWFYPMRWDNNYKEYNRYHYGYLEKVKKMPTDMLLGCSHIGFFLLDMRDHMVSFQSVNIKRERTYAIHNDNNNVLWLGTANGIFHFDFKDSTYNKPDIAHPAFYHRVEDIDEMPDSTLFFGTKGFGVIFWKGDSILQVTDDDGLTSNMLEDVHMDENGICWAGTLNGLNKITFSENGRPVVRAFTVSNGLPSNEIYQVKSYEGQVWLCTAGGLVKFHERPENMESVAPIIQWAKVNNKLAELVEYQPFDHNSNNFEFRYLAINYRLDGHIPYRYRINPKDEWQYTQNLSVNYPALPPGNYRFEVQAQNEDRHWSESTVYPFTIFPPWWATWWFRSISFLAVALAGYSFYRNRTRQLKKENEMQRQMTELEKSALQAQMNPHFIFNSLNSIQNFILKNDQKNAVEYLSKFAKLVRHNLNASVQGEISLEEEINMLENYLSLEQQRFENQFEFEINVADQLKDQYIEIPPMLIQPYVENAVKHGISNNDKKGEIKINFNLNNNFLTATILDNGKGISNDINAENRTHKSFGMGITQKRLELLEPENKNAVRISDLYDKNDNVVGTAVNILIRLKK